MHDQHKLAFPCWWTGKQLAHKFGLAYRVPEEQQGLYRSTFINLPHVNGDSSWELPIPATFVIDRKTDRDSTILFASANEDYTERPEPLEILSAVEAGRSRPPIACLLGVINRPTRLGSASTTFPGTGSAGLFFVAPPGLPGGLDVAGNKSAFDTQLL